MIRCKPLRPKRWGIKPKRATRVSRKTEGEREFTEWVHGQACHVWFIHGGVAALAGPVHGCECSGRVEQSHLRHNTGLGRKESDFKSVPMCSRHHQLWEQHAGPFKGLTNMQRFALMTGWIAEVHRAYERDTGKRLEAA